MGDKRLYNVTQLTIFYAWTYGKIISLFSSIINLYKKFLKTLNNAIIFSKSLASK
uniref:Uncharacterized protein n=1 Tax=Anguilla anguilla TaxID=7936 RepID=A0A0E9Y117_ANGAN